MIKGAMIAPQDCVLNALAICPPSANIFLSKNVPNVTNHAPQIKNWRKFINVSRNLMFIVDSNFSLPDFLLLSDLYFMKYASLDD